jgi:PAS domain S-box-containing protein
MAQTVGSLLNPETFTTRPCILLADTDPQMRGYLTQLLIKHYEVDAAPDPSTALTLARDRTPDLVVANLSMRETDEFELLREFGRDELGKIPVILYSTADVDETALEGSANEDVIAPFSERQLLALIRAYLGIAHIRHESLQAFRLSEDRFRTLKTMMTPGVWVAAPDGAIIGELAWWWEKMTGQTPEQYNGFGWLDALHPDDKPHFTAVWKNALENTIAYQTEFRVRHADDSFSYVRCQGAPVLDGHGNVRGWIGTLIDIDQSRRTEEALRSSEERHRTFMAMTTLVVWTASPNGDMATDVYGWAELTGQTPDQYRGLGWLEALHPEDRPRVLEDLQRAFHLGTPLDVEFRVRRKDGFYRLVRDRAIPLRNSDGSVREWIGALIDIDERKRVEEALSASEERYRTLTTATTTAVWNATATGEIVGECQGWESMTGQTPAQYRGWGWLDVVHPEDKPRIAENWRQVLRQASPLDVTYRTRRRDGSYGHVRAQGAPVFNRNGTVREWIGTIVDIDEQKRAEEALCASEQEYRANFEMAGIGQVQTDAKTGRYLRVNSRFCEMVGYSSGELLTMTYLDIMHPEDRDAGMSALLGMLRGGTYWTYERRYVRKDGSTFWGLATSTLLLDAHRRPLRTITMIEDVTDRRQAEALSGCQKRALEMVAQGASLGEVLDYVILAVEKYATAELRASIQLLDYEGKRFRICAAPSFPENFRRTMASDPANYQQAPCALAVRTKRPVIVSDLINSKEWSDLAGVLAPHEIRSLWSIPILSSDQMPLGSFCLYSPKPRTPGADEQMMIESVTQTVALAIERKETEAQREALFVREQEAREQAEAANRMKDEFLAVVSHELRTPLNAINGWVYMLLSGTLDDAAQLRALQSIQRQVRSQCQLIDDLLDVARIVSGKLRLELREVDPARVIHAALDVVRPAADAKQIDLVADLDASINAVSADSERLQQVIWNLLSNAIKFTPEGGCVEIRSRRFDSGIEIVVTDTGQGISPDFLPYVFDRFQQADVSTTRTHGGIGLGLAIVRHLVELHGGTVFATSAGKGKGATFTIRLPVRAVRSSRPKIAAGRQEREGTHDLTVEERDVLEGVRVLVVEDNSEDREVLFAELAHHGATVSASSCVADALNELNQFRPDVLVADIGMPGEDGYSLIRKVRRCPHDHGGLTPAIALTAYAGDSNRKRALEAGYQKHMTKPADPSELTRTIVLLARPGRLMASFEG